MFAEVAVPATLWYMALIQSDTPVTKAVGKLLETIGEQAGFFLAPGHIRRKGKAETEVMIAEAKARAEIAVIEVENKLAIQNLEDRAAERVRKREVRRQRNIEAITAEAAAKLPETVSDNPVDQDWVAEFLDCSQDVTDEQMQSVWGRILAGEVARPGSFSKRTLAAVRVMSKSDADLFSRLCSMVWTAGDAQIAVVPEFNDRFGGHLILEEIGLITDKFPHGFEIGAPGPVDIWRYFGRTFRLSHHSLGPPGTQYLIKVGNLLLTQTGTELARVAGGQPDPEYLPQALSYFRTVGWNPTEV